MAMIELQQNRYLWVHFAGLAFVPLLLDISLAGFASAEPALPYGGQFWIIALLCISPALAMQWFKPFYVFSLPPSALKPSVLSEDQRRCLTIFKSWQIKALAIATAILSVWLLAQIYAMSPQVAPLFIPSAGLLVGASAFFVASTFMQISVSAGRALLIGPSALKRVDEVEENAIARDFLILGIRVNKLLPETFESKESATEKAKAYKSRSIATTAPSTQSTNFDIEASREESSVLEEDLEKERVEETSVESLSVEHVSELTENNETEKIRAKVQIDREREEDQKSTQVDNLGESVEPSEEIEVVIPERLPPEEEVK